MDRVQKPIKWLFNAHTNKSGRTYVVAYYNRWDAAKKQSRTAERIHVGRLAPETNEVIISSKFAEKMHEYAGGQWFFEGNRLVSRQPGEIPKALRENAGEAWKGEVVSVGLSWACWELARKSGIYRDLQEIFGKEKTRKLLTIASYMLYTGKSVVRDVDEWQRDVWLPKDEKLSPEVVSDLLAGAKTYLHLYKDFTLEHDQKMNLMSSVRKIVDAMNQKEQVDSNEYDRYARFITGNKNTGRFEENLELLAKESELFGAFVLRSNVISDPLVALKFYRMRNSVEASFRQFKNCARKGRLRPVERICTGQIFTFVLAESLRMMLLMASKNAKTGKKLPKDSLMRLLFN